MSSLILIVIDCQCGTFLSLLKDSRNKLGERGKELVVRIGYVFQCCQLKF
jgi:hypothetical protein